MKKLWTFEVWNFSINRKKSGKIISQFRNFLENSRENPKPARDPVTRPGPISVVPPSPTTGPLQTGAPLPRRPPSGGHRHRFRLDQADRSPPLRNLDPPTTDGDSGHLRLIHRSYSAPLLPIYPSMVVDHQTKAYRDRMKLGNFGPFNLSTPITTPSGKNLTLK